MKLKMMLHVFAFTIFVGVVSGSKLCFSNEMKMCLPKNITDSLIPEISGCKKTSDCLTEAAETCDEENSSTVKEILTCVSELCTTGSDIQKKILENQECYKGVLVQKINCVTDKITTIAGINGKQITDEQQKKIYKVICSFHETTRSCVHEAYKKSCGDASEYLFTRLEEPIFKLDKEVCVEVGSSLSLKANLWCIILQVLFVAALFHWTKT